MSFLLGLDDDQISWCIALAWLYGFPLSQARSSNGVPFVLPYSSGQIHSTRWPVQWRNSAGINDFTCETNCFHFDFLGPADAGPSAAVTFEDIINNRDLWTAYVGINFGMFQWVSDGNGNLFPDEFADLLDNNEDPMTIVEPRHRNSKSSCMVNDTADLDDDFDGVLTIGTLTTTTMAFGTSSRLMSTTTWMTIPTPNPLGNFFTGYNCDDQDDDGTDTDPDGDGWYQSVWDRGRLGQGLLFPNTTTLTMTTMVSRTGRTPMTTTMES